MLGQRICCCTEAAKGPMKRSYARLVLTVDLGLLAEAAALAVAFDEQIPFAQTDGGSILEISAGKTERGGRDGNPAQF